MLLKLQRLTKVLTVPLYVSVYLPLLHQSLVLKLLLIIPVLI